MKKLKVSEKQELKVSEKQVSNLKKLLLLTSIMFTMLFTNAQCDFSKIKFTSQQQGNSYSFSTNILKDSCWDYNFTAYSYSEDEIYQLNDWGGWTQVTFNIKGNFDVKLNVTNNCLSCDTTFIIPVDITIFKEFGFEYSTSESDCKTLTFELKDRKDSCTEYYYTIYKGDDYINNLSKEEWETISDSILYFNYGWLMSDVVYHSSKPERTLTHSFSDTGRYLVLPLLYNQCTKIDTWAIKRVDVCSKRKTTGINQLKPNIEEVKIIGYYNMMGEQVYYLQPNKIYIVLYSNGIRSKVMKLR